MRMKFLFLSIFFVLSSQEDFFNNLKLSNTEAWNFYKKKFNLRFSGNYEAKRRAIFEKNLKFINDFNRKNTDVKLDVNRFAHFDKNEIHCKSKLIGLSKQQVKTQTTSDIYLHSTRDWRDFDVVSPVEEQGYCGACWAFSSSGAIESGFALKNGAMTVLSKQQLIDCTILYGNNGCCGGSTQNAYLYAVYHGITSQNNYPYKEKLGECLVDPIDEANGFRILNYRSIVKDDEIALVRALSFIGPVSISIDANHDEFRFYKSGILNIIDCSSSNLTHGGLAVGYDLDSIPPYLLVKNSYGTGWGENGYFRIALFKNNMCGIATAASFPIPRLPGTIFTT